MAFFACNIASAQVNNEKTNNNQQTTNTQVALPATNTSTTTAAPAGQPNKPDGAVEVKEPENKTTEKKDEGCLNKSVAPGPKEVEKPKQDKPER